MKTRKFHLMAISVVVVTLTLASCSLFPGDEAVEEAPVIVIDDSIISAQAPGCHSH